MAELLAAWSFEASPIPDESGNGHAITLSGGTVLTAADGGKTGRGLTQTGSEIFTAFPLTPELQPAQRSWMCNVQASGVSIGWVGEFYRATDTTGVWGLLDLRNAGGSFQFRAKDPSGVEHHVDLTAPTSFTNICATYDGTDLRVYLDAVLAGSVAVPAIWDATEFRLLDGTGTVAKIDDMRLFSGVLTPEEIQAWAALPANQAAPPTPTVAWDFDGSGPVVDVVGGGHDFEITAPTARTGPGGGYTYGGAYPNRIGLTQSTDAIQAGPSPFAETPLRTMVAWIKSSGEVVDGRIFENIVDGSTSTWEFLMRGSTWHVQAWNASNFFRASTPRPTDGAYHFWAATYDGVNLKLYQDAVLKATTSTPPPLLNTSSQLYVLRSTGPLTTISDAQFFTKALSQIEIAALMETPPLAPPAPASGGRLKYESAPGVWTPVALKTETGNPLVVKTETSPGTWEALP